MQAPYPADGGTFVWPNHIKLDVHDTLSGSGVVAFPLIFLGATEEQEQLDHVKQRIVYEMHAHQARKARRGPVTNSEAHKKSHNQFDLI